MSSGEPEISVVVPVFNEAPNLRALFARTVAVLERNVEGRAVDAGLGAGDDLPKHEMIIGDAEVRSRNDCPPAPFAHQ